MSTWHYWHDFRDPSRSRAVLVVFKQPTGTRVARTLCKTTVHPFVRCEGRTNVQRVAVLRHSAVPILTCTSLFSLHACPCIPGSPCRYARL